MYRSAHGYRFSREFALVLLGVASLCRSVTAQTISEQDARSRIEADAAGWDEEAITFGQAGQQHALAAGGAAHLIAFVGHNGLMDSALDSIPTAKPAAAPRSSTVLACASRHYFQTPLLAGGSFPLLLTTGLMAPEAYTLDAAVREWFGGGTATSVCDDAARAYSRYQRCPLGAARILFECR